MTREDAINATHHQELHAGECKLIIGSRGGTTHRVEVWRVNGRCQTWKTRPADFSLPIKYGFKGPHSYVTPQNMHVFHLASECSPTVVTK